MTKPRFNECMFCSQRRIYEKDGKIITCHSTCKHYKEKLKQLEQYNQIVKANKGKEDIYIKSDTYLQRINKV